MPLLFLGTTCACTELETTPHVGKFVHVHPSIHTCIDVESDATPGNRHGDTVHVPGSDGARCPLLLVSLSGARPCSDGTSLGERGAPNCLLWARSVPEVTETGKATDIFQF